MRPPLRHAHPLAVAALLLAVLASGARAQAQPQPPPSDDRSPAADSDTAQNRADDARARELYRDGEAHYAAGRYEDAARSFDQAYQLSGRTALLFNLGNTYERMGRYALAADYLRRYLASPKVRDAVSVRERIRRLDAAARAQAEREAASVRPVAEPLTHPDGDPDSDPEARADDAARSATRTGMGAVPGPSDRGPERASRMPGVILLASSAVALLGAGALGLAARSAGDDADSACASATGLCLDSARDDLDREERYARLADASAALGAVALGVGIYLLVRADRSRPAGDARGPALQPALTSAGFGVQWSGAF